MASLPSLSAPHAAAPSPTPARQLIVFLGLGHLLCMPAKCLSQRHSNAPVPPLPGDSSSRRPFLSRRPSRLRRKLEGSRGWHASCPP